jgi:hypothetical protein
VHFATHLNYKRIQTKVKAFNKAISKIYFYHYCKTKKQKKETIL